MVVIMRVNGRFGFGSDFCRPTVAKRKRLGSLSVGVSVGSAPLISGRVPLVKKVSPGIRGPVVDVRIPSRQKYLASRTELVSHVQPVKTKERALPYLGRCPVPGSSLLDQNA